MTENTLNDEISLKELILKLVEWKSYLLSKWKLISVVAIAGGLLGLGYSIIRKPIYKAELTFVLEEDSKTGGLGAYAGIASQFGIDLGGGSSGVFAGDNIIELMKSRSMIEKTLLTGVNINGKQDLLINLYSNFTGLRKQWDKDTLLEDIVFPVQYDRSTFSRRQDSVLGVMCEDIKKETVSVDRIDKKLAIIAVKCNSKNEQFSKYFTEQLVQNVSQFYVDTKTRKSRANLDIIQRRTDSVKGELDAALQGRAVFMDQNLNLIKQEAGVSRVKKERDVQVLTAMYTELIKNLEITKIALLREKPLIQVVDLPVLPLKMEKIGKIKGVLIGGFLSGFLVVLFLIVKRIYLSVLN